MISNSPISDSICESRDGAPGCDPSLLSSVAFSTSLCAFIKIYARASVSSMALVALTHNCMYDEKGRAFGLPKGNKMLCE
jgi:hypothetical protein